MASRADDRYPRERSRSRSRERPYRYSRHERSVERDRFSNRDEDREKGKGRVNKREDERRHRSRSRSPVRRSRSRSRARRRSRSYSRDKDRDDNRRDRSRERRRRSHSCSQSIASDVESESDYKKHKKKSHKKKRSRSRDRKERRKEKREKKKKSATISHQWGKYGIINETDIYNKDAEFRAWLVEERMINPETISKEQTKNEFAKFMEDYNTATLSHEKFYNIASYESRMSALRSGEFVPPPDDGYDPNADLRALQSTHKRKPKEAETYMSREQLMELRRVQAERIEAGKMKLLGMDIKQNMGVRMDGSMFDD